VLGVRRSPKRATVVAVFDKLDAIPSLLTHPNLTIEVLLLREDHLHRPQPATTRGRTRDPGERRLVELLARSRCVHRKTSSRRGPRCRSSRSPHANSQTFSAAARSWRSARCTACDDRHR
jgi:hypothetical protein